MLHVCKAVFYILFNKCINVQMYCSSVLCSINKDVCKQKNRFNQFCLKISDTIYMITHVMYLMFKYICLLLFENKTVKQIVEL